MGDEDAKLTDGDVQALKEMAERWRDSKMGRRSVLASIFGVTAGAAGAGGFLSGSASAQADTTDSVGDVGQPADRVDIFADGVDANQIGSSSTRVSDIYGDSVNAGDLSGRYPGKVRAISDGEVVASVDPANTTTPVADAAAKVADSAAGTGTVLLPPTTVQEGAELLIPTGVSVQGWGAGEPATGDYVSAIEFPDGVDGLGLDGYGGQRFNGFALKGPGPTSSQATALRLENVTGSADPRNVNIGEIAIDGWYGTAVATGSTSLFQSDLGRIYVNQVDSGDVAGVFNLDFGLEVTAEQFAVYPTDDTSGSDSTILDVNNLSLELNSMNIGGSAGQVLNRVTSTGYVVIGSVNWEPTTQNTVPAWIFEIKGENVEIGRVEVRGEADNVYGLTFDCGKLELGRAEIHGGVGGAINNNRVIVQDDLSHSCIYKGDSADVNNNSGATLSNPVSCLGDQTLVT